jgi:DNA-binding transcriptional MerR regulator
MHSATPAFNLKAVLKETGLAADTLRAWERRYGLPAPQRSPGGHRLYTQRDIETIKWLMARQAEGLSISRAVDMWNEQTASGQDPLADSAPQSVILSSGANLEATRNAWLSACLLYDTVQAEHLLNQAFAANAVEIVCTEILLRGLYEIGELWHKGIASVQQEHFTSAIAMRRLEGLISAAPPPTRAATVITACPPREEHVFPLTLLTLFLRRRGWNVIYLGANVPIERMEETVQVVRPKLVVLSAQTLITAVSLREMARLLNGRGVPTAFGGRVFNTITLLYRRIPAHFLGNTIETSLPKIETLIAQATPSPVDEAPSPAIIELAAAYARKRPLIETALREEIESQQQVIEYLDTAVHFLGNALAATLQLGNIGYLAADIDWLIHLLNQHQVSLLYLPQFLRAYAQATRLVMGESSQPIYSWLELEAQKLTSTTVHP